MTSLFPIPNLTEIMAAIVIVSIFSILYKDNPMFRIIQSVVTGVATANLALTAITAIDKLNLQPIIAGEYTYLISLAWGLLSYTFFIPRLRGIYRILMAAFIATELAIITRGRFSFLYNQTLSWSGGFMSDPIKIVYPIIVISEYIYFLYWKKSDDVIGPYVRIPRLIARYAFGIFFAFAIGGMMIQAGTAAISQILRMNLYGGMWVVLIAVIVIAIDALVGWSKILGIKNAMG